MAIKYTDNIKDYENMLHRVHGGLSMASANTVNEAADIVEREYKVELNKFTLRNKFTVGAVKKYRANAKRSTGDFRPIQNINARVGVLKMRGGKDHYLKKQEEGGTSRGNSKTMYKVAFAQDEARTGTSRRKPIKGALQLQKSGRITQLQFPNGRPIGVQGDGFTPSQRWGILYKYTGLSGRGKPASTLYPWDLSKQFIFTGIRRGLGVFKAIGKRIHMMRQLNKTSVNIKPTRKFQKSFNKIDKNRLSMIMVKNAKIIAGIK